MLGNLRDSCDRHWSMPIICTILWHWKLWFKDPCSVYYTESVLFFSYVRGLPLGIFKEEVHERMLTSAWVALWLVEHHAFIGVIEGLSVDSDFISDVRRQHICMLCIKCKNSYLTNQESISIVVLKMASKSEMPLSKS